LPAEASGRRNADDITFAEDGASGTIFDS